MPTPIETLIDQSAAISHFASNSRYAGLPLAVLELKNAANVYTLHDLVPLRLPYTTLDNKRYYYRLTKMLTDTADHSETVTKTFNVSEQPIVCTPSEAVDTFLGASLDALIIGPFWVERAAL
jgi:hypothetical protein